MFGIFFGILCLVGFVAVWRGRFRRGCHGGYGRRFGRGRHYARGGYFGLYRLFEELDTSPGQEKAIRSALDELRQTLGALRPRLKETRHHVATAFSSDALDVDAVERALDAPLQDVSQSRGALVTAIAKVHEALDADQRRRFARFVDALPYGHAF
ncbi:MAG TPA: periplasmic heavy metal sensor [Polyangiaceae bacterium]|nr:periplasmic heavy metal sensor [Polyangiaceae bacterium]